jgi:hypothetical protein
MISRSRLILAFAFLAAVILASAVLFRFYAEGLRVHMLQPVLNAYLVARYYLDFVPQWILWMLPLFFACALLIRQAFRQPRDARSVRPHWPDIAAAGEGELARLVQQIHRAHRSRFARVRLSRTLVEIATRVIAARQATSLPRARQSLESGYWRSERAVHEFLIPRRHYTSQQSDHEFEQSLRKTVEHLEALNGRGQTGRKARDPAC